MKAEFQDSGTMSHDSHMTLKKNKGTKLGAIFTVGKDFLLYTSPEKCEIPVRMAEELGEHSFASPISRPISHLEFFWVRGLSHLRFANAQKVHQTDSNPGPLDQ